MEEKKTNSLGKKIAKNVDVRCSAAGWAKSIVIQKALEEYFKKYAGMIEFPAGDTYIADHEISFYVMACHFGLVMCYTERPERGRDQPVYLHSGIVSVPVYRIYIYRTILLEKLRKEGETYHMIHVGM